MESENFNAMDRPALMDYLTQNDDKLKTIRPFLSSVSRETLVKLALSKYFGSDFVKSEPMEPLPDPAYFEAARARRQHTM
jgi:hypothetical protein